MKPYYWLLFLLGISLLAFSGPGAVWAGESPDTEQAWEIGDFINLAYQNNPTIAVKKAEWRAVVEQYRVKTGLPDPELNVTYFPQPIETRLGPQDWNLTFSQKFPFPGQLAKEGELVRVEAVAARLELDKAVRDVTVAVRESCHEILYIRRAREITARTLKLLQHLIEVGQTAYANRQAMLVDVLKAQSQVGQIQYDLLLLEDLEQTEAAKLNGLLDRPPEMAIAVIKKPPFLPLACSLKEIYKIARVNREEILIAEAKLAQAGLKVDLAKYYYYPDFKVGVYYASIGQPDVAVRPNEAGRDAVGVQFGLTIPLWFSKNEGRVQSARAGVLKSQAVQTESINQTNTKIRAVYFKLTNSRRIIELHQNELIPQALKAMNLAETWYKQGEASFSDFVETEVVYHNFQLALARAKADYGRYLARLEQLVSRSLTGPGCCPPAAGEAGQ